MSLLSRLRDPEDPALNALAELLVADALDRPAADVVDRARWPKLVVDTLQAWLAAETAQERLVTTVQEGIDALGTTPGPLGQRLPGPVVDGLRRLAARPHSPSRALVLRLLDQEPVRRLLREILLDAVTGFASRVRETGEATAIGGLAGGLGRFAKRRAGSLGALAGEVVGAVGSEVERQMERRASEFVDGALGGVLGRIADQLADPARAADQAALRSALLDSALGLTGPELADELRRSDPAGLGTLVHDALRGWVDAPGFEEQVAGWLDELVARAGVRTLRTTLLELDLLESVQTAARSVSVTHARRVVDTDAFADWLHALEEP